MGRPNLIRNSFLRGHGARVSISSRRLGRHKRRPPAPHCGRPRPIRSSADDPPDANGPIGTPKAPKSQPQTQLQTALGDVLAAFFCWKKPCKQMKPQFFDKDVEDNELPACFLKLCCKSAVGTQCPNSVNIAWKNLFNLAMKNFSPATWRRSNLKACQWSVESWCTDLSKFHIRPPTCAIASFLSHMAQSEVDIIWPFWTFGNQKQQHPPPPSCPRPTTSETTPSDPSFRFLGVVDICWKINHLFTQLH